MKPRQNPFLRSAVLAASSLALSFQASATDYQWDGSTDSNWQDADNWAGAAIPVFNISGSHRLNVNSATKLLYTSAEGTTVYANTASGGRGLVIGSSGLGSGEMEITGGSFSTLGSTAADVIGNSTGNTGILTINGGTYIGTNAGTSLGIGGGPTSILNVLAGKATVANLNMNATTATVNLSGTGELEVNNISRTFSTVNTASINFDGGTLRARIDTTAFLQGLNAATINAGGVTIDTINKSITIGQNLLAGTGSGGLTKTGSGNLTLTGANTYTGLTTVNNGQLHLNTTGGGAIAGDITLTSTTSQRTYLRLFQDDQIASTSTLDMELTTSGAYSEIALQGNSQTLAAINPTWVSTGNIFIENRVFGDNGGGDGVLTINGSTDSIWGSRVLVRDGQSGTLSLVKDGSGTLTLGSANSYTGSTTISGGKIVAGNNAALGSTVGGTTVSGTGILDINGYNLGTEVITISGNGDGNGALVNNGAEQTNAIGRLVLAADASIGGTDRWDLRNSTPTLDMGGFTLTKTGSNYVALVAATVSNPGNIDITEGLLGIQTSTDLAGSSTNAITVRDGATLEFYGSSNALPWTVNLENNATLWGESGSGSNNTISGPISLTSGSAILKADSVLNLSGSISGSGGFSKIGGSTVSLTGDNSYSGATSVDLGILELGHANALGSSSSISVASGATLRVATGSTGNGRTVTINGSGASFFGALQGPSSTSVTWAGDVVLGSDQARIGGGDSGTLTIGGVISDAGNGYSPLFSRAPNSTTVLNNVNTYTGDTLLYPNTSTVNLKMGVANAINSNSRIMFSAPVSGTANIDLNGYSQNVRALVDTYAANMIVTNNGSSDAVLTLSESNAANSAEFDGQIKDGTTNKISVVKTGAGTQIFSGTNTYTGATTVSGGKLAIGSGGSIANSSTIHIASGATLDVSSATSFTVGSAQTVTGSGSLVATGQVVTANGTLSPGNSPGTLTVDGGSLQLGAGGNLNWQVYDVDGAAGTGYDTVNLTNAATLDLSLLSAVNQYNINLWSLSGLGPDVNGDAINFDNTQSYSWTLFSTDSAISGFDASYFNILVGASNGTSGFSNDLGGGAFSVGLADSDTDLVLNFTPVPEPRAALLGSLGMLMLLRRRRD